MQKTAVLLIFIFIITVSFFLYFAYYSPKSKISDEIIVEIPSGVSVKSIGEILEENGIISNADIFYYTIRLFDKNYSVNSGKYILYKNSGIFRAIETLRKSPIPEDISITIPEGLTIWETAKIAAETYKLVDSSEFIALCENQGFIEECGIFGVKSLEGYLFPETYRFLQNSTARDIILRLVSTHKDVMSKLSKSKRAEKFTNNELVILASIIEEETKVADERPIVSGVFYNRLDRKMPIGADATVRFAVKNFDRPIRKSELNSNSPYNTRKFAGLPAGAICSPGKTSLNAALNPSDTDALFFMAKWDGSGTHIFTKTNSEHERVKNEVFKKNKNLKNF